jgi:hypothetical protein
VVGASPQALKALLNATSTAAVDAALAEFPIATPEEYQRDYDGQHVGTWREGYLHWLPVGLDRGNSGRIKLAGEPTNPIAERLVNGMEALIELERLRELKKQPDSAMPISPRDAVQRYFKLPRLDLLPSIGGEEGKALTERVRKVRKKLQITLAQDSKSKEFSVEVRDFGMGQTPPKIHRTLLSLGNTDKAEKPYLIGVFGQGGSSAFAASSYSVIVSRRCSDVLAPGENDGVGWTVVKKVVPKRPRRDPYFAYLATSQEGAVPRFDAAIADKAGFEFGSSFRHIKYDFASGGSAIARVLYQALNHVLFNPILPYELFALKSEPDQMMGTAHRLARLVRNIKRSGEPGSLDKSFSNQAVV